MIDPADAGAAVSQGRTYVVARFQRNSGQGVAVSPYPNPAAGSLIAVQRMDTGEPVRFGTRSLSPEALEAGWVAEPLAPGRYFMLVRPNWRNPSGRDRRFVFDVPDGTGAVYIGTFAMDCGDAGAVCGVIGNVLTEREGSIPPVPGLAQQPVSRLASSWPPARAFTGWPPPARIEATVAMDAWKPGFGWRSLVGDEASAAARRTSRQFGDAAWQASRGSDPTGAIIAAPFALGAVAAGAAASRAGSQERAAATAAEGRWGACIERLGAALPSGIRIGIGAQGASAAAAVRRPAAQATVWHATVTRVTLRACATPGHLGVEVATRWTAADREAMFVRTVSGARIVSAETDQMRQGSIPPMFAWPASWETPVGPQAECRPIEVVCAPNGAGLVRRDVEDALVAARDHLMRPR
jgi:hypothetical protein